MNACLLFLTPRVPEAAAVLPLQGVERLPHQLGIGAAGEAGALAIRKPDPNGRTGELTLVLTAVAILFYGSGAWLWRKRGSLVKKIKD